MAQCSPEKGWMTKKREIKWSGDSPEFKNIDSGIVDNEHRIAYFFTTYKRKPMPNGKTQNVRNDYYECKYSDNLEVIN